MSIAQHIAHGRGVQVFMPNYSDVSEPVAAWSPGFPVLLAVFVLLKIPFLDSTWFVSLGLFGLNIFLLSFIVWLYSRNYLLMLLVGLALCVEQSWLHYHSYILSEPLNMVLVNLSFLVLWLAVDSRRTGGIFLAALLTGAATMTRYAGVAHCAAGALAIFLLWQGPLWRKLKQSSLFFVVSFLPFCLWSIRNILVTRKPGDTLVQAAYGSLVHDPPNYNSFGQNFLQSFQLIGQWSGEYLGIPWVVSLSMIFIFLFLYTRIKPRRITLPVILAVNILLYIINLSLLLWASKFNVPIPERYLVTTLSHIFLLLVITGHDLFGFAALHFKKIRTPLLIVLCLILLIVASHRASEIMKWHARLYNNGPDGGWGMRWGFVERLPWLPEHK